MTALYVVLIILGVILLALAIIAMLRIRFMLSYYGGYPRLDIKVAFLEYEDYFEDLDLESLELQLSLQRKKKKKPSGVKTVTKAKKRAMPSISDALKIIKDGLCLLLKYFSRYARLDKYRVRISLATEDPARTAILYGSLAGVVGALHEYAYTIKKRSYREGDIYTEYKPDFYAEKSDVAIDINFSLRVWQYLVCYYIYNRAIKDLKQLPPKAAKKKGETKR